MSETVEMVKRLRDETEKDVTIAALAEELKLDKSAAWRRVCSAMDRGYLENLEDRKGRPAKLVEADALPDDIEILPTPERLQGCTVASDSGGVKTNNLLSPLIRHKKRTSTHPPENNCNRATLHSGALQGHHVRAAGRRHIPPRPGMRLLA